MHFCKGKLIRKTCLNHQSDQTYNQKNDPKLACGFFAVCASRATALSGLHKG